MGPVHLIRRYDVQTLFLGVWSTILWCYIFRIMADLVGLYLEDIAGLEHHALQVRPGGEVPCPVWMLVTAIREVVIIIINRPRHISLVQGLQVTSRCWIDHIYIRVVHVYVPVKNYLIALGGWKYYFREMWIIIVEHFLHYSLYNE